MYQNVTLNEFIAELQKLAVEHGNDEILSIGSSSGKIAGMSSPFCFNFKGHDATEFVPAYHQDVKVQQAAPELGLRNSELGDEFSISVNSKTNFDNGLRHVWARVGMTLDITPEEENAIFNGDYMEGKAAVVRAVMDGRASLDGETYIPEECIQDFDDEYGTTYQHRDEECAWTMDGLAVQAYEAVHQKSVNEILADASNRSVTSPELGTRTLELEKD